MSILLRFSRWLYPSTSPGAHRCRSSAAPILTVPSEILQGIFYFCRARDRVGTCTVSCRSVHELTLSLPALTIVCKLFDAIIINDQSLGISSSLRFCGRSVPVLQDEDISPRLRALLSTVHRVRICVNKYPQEDGPVTLLSLLTPKHLQVCDAAEDAGTPILKVPITRYPIPIGLHT